MALLPAAALLLLWLLFRTRGDLLGFPGLTVRGALVLAFGAYQVLLVLVTEGWSVPGQLTPAAVGWTWAAIGVALLVCVRRELAEIVGGSLRARVRGSISRLARVGADVAVALGLGAAFFTLFAMVCWLYRPANGDSLVYHLARVEHWIQNQSVSTYATHYLAQVELGPLSSYNFAHLHVLTGNDRFDAYVLWLATAVCVVGASELARRLGLGLRGQAFSAVLCLTIPNLVLEATSTQNNNFAAAVGVTTVLVLTSPWNGAWVRRGLAAGCSGGLALLAKGTLVPLLGPVCLLLVFVALRRRWAAEGRRVAARIGAAAAAAVVAASALAGPFVLRNVEMFGAPSGPVSASTISTDLTILAAVGNVLRSTAGEFAIDDTPFPKPVAGAVQEGLSAAFDLTGVDPTDPRYLLGNHPDAFKHPYGGDSDRAEEAGANPYHTILVAGVLAALAYLALKDRRRYRLPLALAASLCLGYLAFTATARWSIFAVRYYTPSLVLWCPLIAWTLQRVAKVPLRGLAALLTVACLPQLLGNVTRPVVPLTNQSNSTLAPYFVAGFLGDLELVYRARHEAYERAVDTIARSTCARVGIANWILIEYPLWAGLRLRDWQGKMQNVQVTNESRRYEVADFAPCVLLREAIGPARSADSGWAAFRFGALAVAVSPTELGPVAAPPRFVGTAGEAEVFPAAGWILPTEADPPSAGAFGTGAELLVRASAAGTYVVRIEYGSGGPARISSPQADRVVRSGNAVELVVRLPAGVTRLELSVVDGRDVEAAEVMVRRR